MADEKVNELMEQLEKGIKTAMDSERYKAFLRIQSQFHNYSFNNAMLIYLQRPDASKVAGFQTWKNKFERNVLRGEKGISILAPCPYKYEKPVEVKNKTTGETETQNKTVEGMRFRKVTVFDVKQTDGKPLPEICNELQGNSVNASNIIKAIKEISEIPIIEKAISSGAKGYYSRLENIIAIKEDMPLDQSAKTHVHEYCHSKLHSKDASDIFDRATKEVQAESVAYIVCNRFGLDTSEYSFDYLANWSSGKELKELKQSFDLIQKTSNDIIEKMEKLIANNIELQQCSVKLEILWSESGQLKAGQVFTNIEEAYKLFTKLDKEQAELRNANQDIDYSKVTAGEQVAYIPYHKTKFEIQLADGRKAEARFDLGESGYKDLYECIKREFGIDVKEYIKEYEQSQQQAKELNSINVLEKIKDLYKNEFPAIVHISEKSASVIDNLNQQNGNTMSVKEIKDAYKEAGKKLEQHKDQSDIEDFKLLKDVVDDLKHAQLAMKQEQAHQKAMLNQISKSRSMEMVQ
jgi:Antirestriction protein